MCAASRVLRRVPFQTGSMISKYIFVIACEVEFDMNRPIYCKTFTLKFYFCLPDISKIKIRSESVTEINRKCEMMFAVISKWNSSRDNVPERIIWRSSEVKWPIIRLFSLLKRDWTLNSGKWWFNLKGWILENLSF